MKKTLWIAALAALGMATATQAAIISIINPSFEDDDPGGDGTFDTSVHTGWTQVGDGVRGTINFANTRYTTADALDANPSGGTIGDMDGNQAFFSVNAVNGGVSQTLGDSIVVGDTYTLTVAVGDHDTGTRAGFSGYDIRLLDGDSTVASISSTVSLGDGTFTDISFSYTAQAGDSGLLGIELREINGSSGKAVDFDNVRLSVIPEPATAGMLLGLVAGLLVFIRRRAA